MNVTRRAAARRIVLSVAGLTLAGCAAPAAAPTSAPVAPAAAPTSAPVAPAAAPTSVPATAGAPANPAAKPATPAPASKAGEWEQIVTRARAEGRLVLLAPPGADLRDQLTDGFRRKYPEIQIDYSGEPGAQLVTKVVNDRTAGRFQADIINFGPTTIFNLMQAKAIDPIRQHLVGPDIEEQTKWQDGKLDFADEPGVHNVVLTTYVSQGGAFNPRLVAIDSLRSWKDLLDPRWKGKVSVADPRTPGQSQTTFVFLYSHPDLGKDFLTQFFASGVVISRDDRQLIDWVAKGEYPFSIGVSQTFLTEAKNKGLPIDALDQHVFREGAYLVAGNGSIAVFDRAPHPNATKVYLNWLLSAEGQTAYIKATEYAPRRQDVPKGHLPPASVPRPGVKYPELYKHTHEALKTEAANYLRSLIP